MGSQCDPSKRHYDITMSKRTRKPISDHLQEANINNNNNHTKWDIPLKTIASLFDQSSPKKGDHHGGQVAAEELEESDHRKSLKQLIHGDESAAGGRSSLSHHFTEEEKQQQQLQLVKSTNQQGHNNNGGVKFKGMMSRYAKVLSHLVKVKREPHIGSRKKRLLRLTM